MLIEISPLRPLLAAGGVAVAITAAPAAMATTTATKEEAGEEIAHRCRTCPVHPMQPDIHPEPHSLPK